MVPRRADIVPLQFAGKRPESKVLAIQCTNLDTPPSDTGDMDPTEVSGLYGRIGASVCSKQ